MPWYRPRIGAVVSRHSSSSVSCCAKTSPALNCSMPRSRAAGGGSAQRARASSFGAPGGCRFGGRADFRERLLGSGVLGSDDLAVAELVLDEFADEIVVKSLGKLLRRLGVCDLDALMQIVARGQVTLRERVEPRVLEMPDGSRLTDRSTGETDGAGFFADDVRVFADLPLGRRAFFRGDVGR